MKKIIFCLHFLLITNLLIANTINLFTPSDYVIEAANLGEDMSDEEFMYFAFAFSEIQENKIPSYIQEYKVLATKIESQLARNNVNDFDKGEYILQFLHTNQFRTYREPITKLNNLFDSGVYNCVSSSILYYALAMRFDLNVFGVRTSDHAFCAININGEVTDVETTSVYGFNPGEKKEFENSFGQTGFVYTPPSNYRDRINIGKIGMLSLIIQNNIVELYKTERFETIAGLAIDMNALLRTEGAFNAMVGEFSNYVTYLSKRNRFSDGIAFLTAATEYYGTNPKFEELAGALFNNALATELAYRTIHQLRQNLQEAKSFFNEHKSNEIIPRDVVLSSQKMIDEATIRIFVEDNDFQTSTSEVKIYFEQKQIPQSMYNDLLMYVYSKEVNLLMKNEKWEEALTLANRALADTINDRRAQTQLQAVQHNVGVFYHNEFAALYNKQNFTEALQKVREGLAIVPHNKTLQNDEKLIQNQQ